MSIYSKAAWITLIIILGIAAFVWGMFVTHGDLIILPAIVALAAMIYLAVIDGLEGPDEM